MTPDSRTTVRTGGHRYRRAGGPDIQSDSFLAPGLTPVIPGRCALQYPNVRLSSSRQEHGTRTPLAGQAASGMVEYHLVVPGGPEQEKLPILTFCHLHWPLQNRLPCREPFPGWPVVRRRRREPGGRRLRFFRFCAARGAAVQGSWQPRVYRRPSPICPGSTAHWTAKTIWPRPLRLYLGSADTFTLLLTGWGGRPIIKHFAGRPVP